MVKKEEHFSEEARVDDPEHALEGELVDIDVVAEALEASLEFPEVPLVENEDEVDFEDQEDLSSQEEPDSFLTVKAPPKRDPLSAYLKRISYFPMLKQDEEYTLAKRWQETGDVRAKEKIIASHLRLVSKIAQGYRGYGMPLLDLISEGHIGIMKALEKFDPEKGVRFSTYAMWWVRAAMKEYVMRNWSLVKTGTTAAQKKLFFNLRSKRRAMLEEGQRYLTEEQIAQIAKDLNVPENSVAEMAKRLNGNDYSLNTPIGGDEEGQWQDWIEDEEENHAEQIAQNDEFKKRSEMLENAFQFLKPRELKIMQMRRLEEPPQTLETIGLELNLSRERVRQIEMKAFVKVQKNVQQQIQDGQRKAEVALNNNRAVLDN
ncbi:MAG: sigma-70 family RNA polymerase sigma factor [Alphaproteobacteria bacterium]|nr:sigma-70 family RNA polymerase sigma factor [Alphaproteobacteria bacterium]NCQ67273.1 sigma-70 family RNA polymerase sigma factor [Alphaproteobacteria bacterium]NCT06760.1 sigma-70 family RNA polymerase sigma factor [Alphaproteobacteria bacterium]